MKTLVLGASTKPNRYAYKAIHLLRQYGHEVVAVGRYTGQVAGVPIQQEHPANETIDTVTLYINPALQRSYYTWLMQLKPRRIIFNPGTENSELQALARQNGIYTEEACTLVLLNTGQY